MTHQTLYALRRPFARVLDVLSTYPTSEELADPETTTTVPVALCPPPHAYGAELRSLLTDLCLYAGAMNLPLNQWLAEAKEAAHAEFFRAETGDKDAD